MSIFNTLHSFWSCWPDSSGAGDIPGPLVNTDGTPMLEGGCFDVMGKPFSVTDTSGHVCSFESDTGVGVGMVDCTSTWDRGAVDFCGSGDLGDGF